MNIDIPELSLVVLIGVSGSGKSTFARRHFLPTEVISSDYCRGLVSDDENNQAVSADAFDVVHYIAGKRLRAGRLTVIDATNVQFESRKPLVALARQYHCLPIALVLDVPEPLCTQRNAARPDRQFGSHVVRNQRMQLHRSLRGLGREGFRHVYVFRTPEELETVQITRKPLWNNRREVHGPFDIIGDIHGCFDEARELMAALGYRVEQNDGRYDISHPEGRKVVFVGDLVDRGPKTPEVIRLAMSAVEQDAGYCVAGNHDVKLVKALRGREVKQTHGLAESMAQLSEETPEFRTLAANFLDGLVSHYVFDEGRLVVAHAGLKEEMHGRGSGRVREFALYGETTGETDEFGLPVRYNWAAEYRGRPMVVYGHTPVPTAEWLNNTICIDTGCVFGGELTALRYPENELVSVPARERYYEPVRPLDAPETTARPAQHEADDVLDLEDVSGKRIVHTRLQRTVTIRQENATAALEVMSRFAASPKWLFYLPPTMAPCATSTRPGLLEHPQEALAYYVENGVSHVVCEEKHMGSRAVIVVCRDNAAARRRFGIEGDETGIVYTRTGRHFFPEEDREREVLDRLRKAIDAADLWSEFASDWFCFDCEIMPWSVKAQQLLRAQYAPVGAAAREMLEAAGTLIAQAEARSLDIATLSASHAGRAGDVERYIEAYGRYCWPVESVADLKIAPFHLLASEGKAHVDRSHEWHMQVLRRLCDADPGWLLATPYRKVALADEGEVQDVIDWWSALTGAGSEGMVVKPMDFLTTGTRGLVQPAVKCRGREYLRIIYEPEYTRPEHLQRLRFRGLAAKRSLALREFALGVESLERFVAREPLRRVHECVFGVLALESEPVDPRL